MIGLGDHARHLADDVGQPGKLANLAPPRLLQPMLDARLANVVEDELHIWAAFDELDHEDHGPMLDADVEAQPVLAD